MRANMSVLAIGLLGAYLAGCRTPPPPRVPVPSETDGSPYGTYQHDEVKPLPPSATQQLKEQSSQSQVSEPVVGIPPAPSGPPPISQRYIEAYDGVGRPRMMVLIDRPAEMPRSLVAGDYDLLERVVRETLAARGQVMVVAPQTVRENIDAQQTTDINAGRADALADAGAKLRADVAVQVRLAPPSGAAGDTQITATARNTRDSQQIATAATALRPNPQRRDLDFAGRLLAERLVDELATAWERLEKQPAPTTAPPSTTPPSAAPPSATPPSATPPRDATQPSTQP